MKELSAQYPRYGYCRIRIFLGRGGYCMSPGRPAVAGRRPAVAAQAPEEARRCCSTAAASAVRAETRYGSTISCSTAVPMVSSSSVTDEFTKEGLAIDVDGRIRSRHA